MTTDIWDYPETEAVHAPSRAHELLVWLSLESLTPFWDEFRVLKGCLTAVRRAARDALEPYQTGKSQRSAETRFATSLEQEVPPAKADEVLALMASLEQFDSLKYAGPWRAYFGENQHDFKVAGLRPDVSALLGDQFKNEVVALKKECEAALRVAIQDAALSEWDLAIHAYYGLNYYSTNQFDKSVVIVGLSNLTDAILFNAFLMQYVMTLPAGDQDALLLAVRQSWVETVADDPIAAMKGIDPDLAAAAAAVIPVSHFVQQL